jgi:hypothetical protein
MQRTNTQDLSAKCDCALKCLLCKKVGHNARSRAVSNEETSNPHDSRTQINMSPLRVHPSSTDATQGGTRKQIRSAQPTARIDDEDGRILLGATSRFPKLKPYHFRCAQRKKARMSCYACAARSHRLPNTGNDSSPLTPQFGMKGPCQRRGLLAPKANP